MINQLLLNLLIIVTPAMAYQIFWGDRHQHISTSTQRRIVVILSCIVSLLCMAFPFRFGDGFQYDLRLIPLAVCVLYAGILPSLWVGAAIVGYLLAIGGSDAALLLAFLLTGTVIFIVWRCKLYMTTESREKNVTAAAIAGFAIGLVAASFSCIAFWRIGQPLSPRMFGYFGLYCLICAIALSAVIYVSEQVRINLQRRNQTQQTEKMNVLGDLAASFAHEIRNPMTVARGFMQMLKQPGVPEDKRMLYTNIVMDEIDKAQSIVNDYLSFAKPHMEAIELVDAKPLIEQALDSVQAYATHSRVDIEAQLDDKLIISANRDKFVQCMVHLCKNGIEAMPNGGKLQIIGTVQNRNVCIDIIDHGVGMTPNEIRRLGTPFYSTREKGTGLGMMVTYRVIQTIHGKIDVTSEVGKGTCFSLLIPTLHATSYH